MCSLDGSIERLGGLGDLWHFVSLTGRCNSMIMGCEIGSGKIDDMSAITLKARSSSN